VANLGDIGTAFVTVELDFNKAFEEAKRAGQNIPPIDLRVDLDQSQVTREVEQKVATAQKAAGQVDAHVDLDQAQVTGAVRKAVLSASASAGSIPVRVNKASLAAASSQIRTGIGGAFTAVGRLASASFIPAAFAVGALGVELKKGNDDAKALSLTMSQVKQSVDVFGKSTGINAKQITNLASEYKKFSSISGNSIKSAEASLLKFGIVNKETLPEMTRLLLDTAVGMKQVGEDGKISTAFAVKFGRSLQDPTKGLSLLARGGVAVTASQKDMIKALVKSGDTAKATAIVQGLLRDQFKGSAAAFGQTIGGQLRIASQSFEEARRDLAIRILPSIVPVIKQVGVQVADALNANQKPIAAFVTGFVKGAGAVIKFVATSKPFHQVVSGIAAVIAGVASGLKGFATSFSEAFRGDGVKKASTFGATVKKLGHDIGHVAEVVLPKLGAALGAVAGFFSEHNTLLKITVGLFVAYKLAVIAGVIQTGLIAAVQGAYSAALIVGEVAVAAYTAAQWLLNAALTANPIGLVVVAIGALIAVLVIAWKKSDTFKKIIIGAWNAIKHAVVAAAMAVKNGVVAAFNAVLGFLKKWGPTVLAVLAGPLGLVVLALAKHWDAIKTKAINVFNFVKNHIVGAITGIKNFLTNIDLSAAGRAIMAGFKDGLVAGFEKVKDFVRSIGSWIKAHKGPISVDRRLLVDEGSAIMSGFLKGLKAKFSSVQHWVRSIGSYFKGAIGGEDLDIGNIIFGTGSVNDLNKQLKNQLNIPASVDIGATGLGGFLHPTSGWADTLSQAHIIEKMFGMHMGSGLRQFDTVPGPGVSQHVLGQAVDWGDASNSQASLNSLAAFASRLPAIFKQVIWQNRLWSGGGPTDTFIGNHLDHVHLGWQARRAAGGGVRKGSPYQWNERGGEMFVPQQSGYVMNAGRTKELVSAIKSLASRPAGGNNDTRTVHVHSNAADPRAVGAVVMSNLGGVFSRA